MDDGELLKRYVAAGSEEAFRLLVERNLPLVYSAALRKTGNSSMAEDVSQVVFIILAKKAHELSKETILAGWLHRTTYHVTMKALVREFRRRQREEKAVQMQNLDQDGEWERLAPVLDDALAELAEAERSAIVLRYFQNRSFRDVGKALGVSDDTAQKKVSRSVDKLRRVLLKRRVAISLAAFAGLTATRAAQFAPATLAGRVVPAALKDTGVSGSVYALLEESIRPVLTLKLAGMWAAGAAALLALTIWIAQLLVPPSLPSSRRLAQQPAASVSREQQIPSAPTIEARAVPVIAQQPAPQKNVSNNPVSPKKTASAPLAAAASSAAPSVISPATYALTPAPASTPVALNNATAFSEFPAPDTNLFSAGDFSYQGSQILLPQNRVLPIILPKRGSTSGPGHEISKPAPGGAKSSGKVKKRQ